MKNNIFFLAITTLFLRGLQSVNAQGIIGKIKKKVEEVKPTTATEPTQKTDGKRCFKQQNQHQRCFPRKLLRFFGIMRS